MGDAETTETRTESEAILAAVAALDYLERQLDKLPGAMDLKGVAAPNPLSYSLPGMRVDAMEKKLERLRLLYSALDRAGDYKAYFGGLPTIRIESDLSKSILGKRAFRIERAARELAKFIEGRESQRSRSIS
ncbi:MAG: hypothetical protein M1160_03910 [Candidatus Marsarchaeota archaeon]|jgi:hypothetical protein|nr:hypothetical protein [Candidatus Marsarchaeota archaeon]MCL5111988.1 hypothetical protein [Candidatus Marsarchaeota archaeon]